MNESCDGVKSLVPNTENCNKQSCQQTSRFRVHKDVDPIEVTSNIQEQNQGSNEAERELELDCLSTAHGTAVRLEGHGYHGMDINFWLFLPEKMMVVGANNDLTEEDKEKPPT